MDDLSYTGVAMNMATGGDFSNPYISREFSEHFAFYYTPFHSYVLLVWLKIFGISASSLTGFQLAMYFLCAASAIFILRRHQSPAWLEWLAPLAATNAFLPFGLRPESMAAAFILAGFAMIECGVRNRILVFLAFLLMVLGGGAAPRMTLYAAALIAFCVWRMFVAPAKDNRERWMPLGLLLAAGALTAVVFSAMIHFEFVEFWKTFRQNSQIIGSYSFVQFIMKHFGYAQAVVGLFALVAFFILWRRPKDDLTRLSMVIAAIIPIEMLAKLSLYGVSRWYILLVCLFLAASLWKQIPAFGKSFLQIGTVLAFLLINCGMFINIIGMLSNQIQETKKQDALPTPIQGHTVFVDCVAARYYFNYHIPKDDVDFMFSVPFPRIRPVYGDANPTDIYLLGPENVDFLKVCRGLDYQPMVSWSPLGNSKLSFYKYPRQTFVISPASKGLRTDTTPD